MKDALATELTSVNTKPDSFCHVWGHVNQLETLLEIIDEDVLGMGFNDEYEKRTHALNRLGNLITTTRAIADDLAVTVGVR